MKFSNHTKAFIILTCLSPIAHGASPDEKTADLSRGISHSHGPTALQARIAANLLVERSVADEVPATLAEVAAASRELAASARAFTQTAGEAVDKLEKLLNVLTNTNASEQQIKDTEDMLVGARICLVAARADAVNYTRQAIADAKATSEAAPKTAR